MNRPRLLRLVLPTSIIIVLLGTYSAWWYHLAAAWRGGLAAWAAEMHEAGWTVGTGQVTIAGFPGTLHLTVPSPSLADPSGDAWQGPPLAILVSPFAPTRPHLSAPGHHRVKLADKAPADLTVGSAAADFRLNGRHIASASFDLSGLAVASAHLGRLTGSVRQLSFAPASRTTPTLALSAALEDLDLPADPRLVLGHHLSSAAMRLRLMGSLPPLPLRRAFAAWRDDGGTVEIDALSLRWPPLGLDATGTLALDQDMQPLLAGTCTVRGLFSTIDALTKAGTVHARDAGMAKLVLAFLAKPAADGEKEWNIPVTVQGRTLYVGPAALMKLPAIDW